MIVIEYKKQEYSIIEMKYSRLPNKIITVWKKEKEF
jgi:hypothetical protein